MAIQNLREDLREHRAETRQDIKDLEVKNEGWHEEVRAEFSAVKQRLDIIETKVAARDEVKKTAWDRALAVMAIIVSTVTAFFIYKQH